MTGDEFRRLRESVGLTKTDLGKRWGITRRAVYNIENKAEVREQSADAIRYVAIEDSLDRLNKAAR